MGVEPPRVDRSVRRRSYALAMEIASAYIFGLIGAGFAARLLWPKRR